MLCPWCNTEMERGLIQSPHEIGWIPGDKKRFFARPELYEDAVVLSELNFFKGSAVTAWLCRGCQKVVVDYAGGAADANKR